MSLHNIPVIDHHLHIFSSVRREEDMGFAITSYPTDPRHLRSMMPYRLMMRELKRLFQMKDASCQEVMAERNRRYDADSRNYIQNLMKDANIQALICDLDAPISAYWTGNYRTDEDAYEFFRLMEPEVQVGRVVRIEIACNKRLNDELPFSDFIRAFYEDMDREIRKFNALALKSVIGYFTGLLVTNPSKEEAQRAYDAFQKDRNNSKAEKTWRDYMLHEGVRICAEKNLPLHIHTGWGDTPYGDLRRLSPFLLYDFLKEDNSRKIPIVLLHAGYPYVRESGILVSQLPQVYVDFSEMLPYASYASEQALLELLETAPTTKVLYGTDGGGMPEPVWLGAHLARESLGEILDKWIQKQYVTKKEALEIAGQLLYKNALELYPDKLGANQ